MANNEEDKFLKKAYPTILKKLVELIPIGNIATTAFDLINEGKRAIDNDKFHNFIMGIQEHDEGDIDLSNESFIALVKRLYLDDESSKTDMYARLAVELAKSNLNPHEKIYYINILSNITYTDIQLAKKYIAYEFNHIIGFKDIKEQLLSITKTTSGIELKSINSLLSNGLIYEENETVKVYKASDELIKFTSMIFSFEEINSNEYGIQFKEEYDVLIINHNKIYSEERGDRLINELQKINISAKIIDSKEVDNFEYHGKYFLNYIVSKTGNEEKIIFELFNGYEKFKENNFGVINRVSSINMKYGNVKDEHINREIIKFPEAIANIVESFNK
ncbi:hypothetical protein [Proteus mirabilis]|uniref:hypothetical protein n=1 Tax=Proteus mirabilis TaxID=584 RepID=UPI0010730283|nr:hypothetical protein [Proteus mirabilis]MDM3831299.1 hypothetical protein [Proteus mirabilis]MEC4044881.1 hypothetical protein [Proteus mirabilis]NHI95956.1 hypothetical protein [Proteus mirabilis]TFT78580.1 hypothetical protein E4V48_19180 [Proteus mirabilis]